MVQLHKNALGLVNSVVMGVAGTAPSFSISVTMAALIGATGVMAPATLLYCGLTMMGIAMAYMFLNKLEANAGAAYAWVTFVFNGTLGFLAGWTLMVSSSLFMISATLPAARATLLLVAPQYAEEGWILALLAIAWLVVVTSIVLRGIVLSGLFQLIMTTTEVIVVFAIVVTTFYRYGLNGVHSIGINHFLLTSFTWSSFISGALIALFLFWGWDVSINLSEETSHSKESPGLGVVFSMFVNVLVFVSFAIVALLVLNDEEIQSSSTNILLSVAEHLFPKPFSYLAVIALMFSTIGTIQTSTLQFTRTLYAKARSGTMPSYFADVHPRWKTPYWATYLILCLGVCFLLMTLFSDSVHHMMLDSVDAIGVQAAFYYGLAALACVWHFRGAWRHSFKVFLLAGLWPFLSTLILWGISFVALMQLNATATTFAIGGIVSGFVPLLMMQKREKSKEQLTSHPLGLL